MQQDWNAEPPNSTDKHASLPKDADAAPRSGTTSNQSNTRTPASSNDATRDVTIVVYGVFGLAAAGSIVYAIRHIQRPASRDRQPLQIRIRPLLRGEVGGVWLPIGAFEVGNLATTLLFLRPNELLTPDRLVEAATSIALLLYAGGNLAATVITIPAGKAADRWGFRPTLTTGFMVGLTAYLTFGLIGPSIPLLVLAFILAGVTIGIVETAEHGTVAEATHEDIRGSAFGFLAAIQSFGNLVASGIAGLLWTLVSPVRAPAREARI